MSINSLIKMNHTALLIDRLKVKPTSLIEWKQIHYITNYLNNNKKVKIYITFGSWYVDEDFLRLEYKSDGTLADCDLPCIWKQGDPLSLSPTELQTVDALFNVNSQPSEKEWKGKKIIKLTLEPKTYYPNFHINYELFDIYSSFDEDSDLPISYVRVDPEIWRTIEPFNLTRLSPNSTLISFIATRMTEYRRTFIPSLQAHISVASFGVIPVIWGVPNVRSYLPHPKSAILIEDFSDVEALANYLKYLAKNEKAYLEYHKWKTMEFSDEFEKKSYISL
ncbi:2660_t:CDS:2, partial [Dentiscutata erythropus]